MKKNEILLRTIENLLDENKRLRAEISQLKQKEMNPRTSEFFESLVNPKVKVKAEPRFEKGGVIHDSGNEPIINKGEDIVPDKPVDKSNPFGLFTADELITALSKNAESIRDAWKSQGLRVDEPKQ